MDREGERRTRQINAFRDRPPQTNLEADDQIATLNAEIEYLSLQICPAAMEMVCAPDRALADTRHGRRICHLLYVHAGLVQLLQNMADHANRGVQPPPPTSLAQRQPAPQRPVQNASAIRRVFRRIPWRLSRRSGDGQLVPTGQGR